MSSEILKDRTQEGKGKKGEEERQMGVSNQQAHL